MILRIPLNFDGPSRKDYYETKRVGAGRGSYSCEYCRNDIPSGTPSEVHKFYPEFTGYRTHPNCSQKFLNSLR